MSSVLLFLVVCQLVSESHAGWQGGPDGFRMLAQRLLNAANKKRPSTSVYASGQGNYDQKHPFIV